MSILLNTLHDHFFIIALLSDNFNDIRIHRDFVEINN